MSKFEDDDKELILQRSILISLRTLNRNFGDGYMSSADMIGKYLP